MATLQELTVQQTRVNSGTSQPGGAPAQVGKLRHGQGNPCWNRPSLHAPTPPCPGLPRWASLWAGHPPT